MSLIADVFMRGAAPAAILLLSLPPAALAAGPGFASSPEQVAVGDAGSESEMCLAMAVYYEAGFERRDGKEAVAQVVLNRLAHPRYPKTVCGVVWEGSERRTGCQFTFTCDGSTVRKPAVRPWEEALDVARRALAGFSRDELRGALNYHADYVRPYWSGSLTRIAQIGRHIFYRPRGAVSARPTATATLSTPGAEAVVTPAPATATIWGIALDAASRGGIAAPSGLRR